ncbi:MAG: serine/threonine protein kinase [Myxococcota bacterium]|nr:serine/threonine protein kinase [Myxococcota bacterium]
MEEHRPDQLGGLNEGQVLAGRYQLEGVIGVGGMGIVLAARHVQLDARVAIKFLLPSMMGHQEAVARFAQEARAAVKITSEYVARVFDVSALEDGRPYIVMELLEGDDVATWIAQRGPMPVEQAVEFLLQTCVALAEAHELGIVHRDLKPSNLFLVMRADGQLVIKVLDFGISKVIECDDQKAGSVTPSLAIMGSPLYMSPEQMRSSKDVDAQTDIWSLGAIAYELLTGTVPFDGATIAEIAVKVASGPPRPIRDARPDVPRGLEAAIAKCLERERADRYPQVGALATALRPFGSARSHALVERVLGIVDGAGRAGGALGVSPQQIAEKPLSRSVVGVSVGPGSADNGKRLAARWAALVAGLSLVGVVLGAWRYMPGSHRADRGTGGHVEGLSSTMVPILDAAVVRVDEPATMDRLQPDILLPVDVARASQAAKHGAAAGSPSTTSSRERPGCNPSFYFDDDGRKHFKPECFLNRK